MNCIIPGLNLKVVQRALQALAKIGDDLYIEAKKDRITFVTLNLSKTVCVQCSLLDSFFSSYNVDQNEFNDNEAVTCKIQIKTLLPLFRGTHLEKKFDFIKIEYENNSDIIVISMKYKSDDTIIVHRLRLMDPELLTIEIIANSGTSNILNSSTFFSQLLNMFSNLDDEIVLEVSKEKIVARNYFIGAPVKMKSVRSQVTLNNSEFISFEIAHETTINFSLKPFRTAIHFAEAFNLYVGINFDKGGRPFTIITKNPTFEFSFIVASLNPYSDTQSTMAAASIPAKITQVNASNINLTREDRDALENENWDDFGVEENLFQKNHNSVMKNKKNSLSDKAAKENDMEVIPTSPESPKAKKAKLVFGRCFQATFSTKTLGEVLAANSDSE